jgi:hypothetical protein
VSRNAGTATREQFGDDRRRCHLKPLATRGEARRQLRGSMIGTHGTRFGPQKLLFAGEMSIRGGANAFGGADELEWLFSPPQEVLPQRGYGLRPPFTSPGLRRPRASRRPLRGSMNRVTAPFVALQQALFCREKGCRLGVRALWGQRWTRLPEVFVCHVCVQPTRIQSLQPVRV